MKNAIWIKSEDERFKTLYARHDLFLEDIALTMDRTVKSILRRANRLQLPKVKRYKFIKCKNCEGTHMITPDSKKVIKIEEDIIFCSESCFEIYVDRIEQREREYLLEEDKVCTKCGVTKKVSDFYKNASQPGGLNYHCKECCGKYTVENKERISQKMKEMKINKIKEKGWY